MAALLSRVRGMRSPLARLQSTVCLRGIPRDSTVEEVSTFLGAIPTERIKFRCAGALLPAAAARARVIERTSRPRLTTPHTPMVARATRSNNPAGKFTGWAVVTCQNAEEEAAVRAKHAANIRHRYIEVLDDHSDRRKEGAS